MIRGWCGPGRWCAWPGRRMAGWPGWWPRCRSAGRQELAAAVLGEAVRLAADPGAGLVERVVARQAAHHVRADLADRSGLTGVQIGLIRGLEKLGDPDAAYEVATAALADLEPCRRPPGTPGSGRNS